jgi:hypothetical protein
MLSVQVVWGWVKNSARGQMHGRFESTFLYEMRWMHLLVQVLFEIACMKLCVKESEKKHWKVRMHDCFEWNWESLMFWIKVRKHDVLNEIEKAWCFDVLNEIEKAWCFEWNWESMVFSVRVGNVLNKSERMFWMLGRKCDVLNDNEKACFEWKWGSLMSAHILWRGVCKYGQCDVWVKCLKVKDVIADWLWCEHVHASTTGPVTP